jgi:hypothetical protein
MAFVAMGQLATWVGCSAGMLETQTTHLLFNVTYFHFSEYSNGKMLRQ